MGGAHVTAADLVSFAQAVRGGLIVRYYPEAELDVVVLANSQGGAWDPMQEIHRRIAADNPRVGPSGL